MSTDDQASSFGGTVRLVECHVLERAFELARSGRFLSTKELLKALSAEGYAKGDPHLQSPSVRLQLRRLCAAARTSQAALGAPSEQPAAANAD